MRFRIWEYTSWEMQMRVGAVIDSMREAIREGRFADWAEETKANLAGSRAE